MSYTALFNIEEDGGWHEYKEYRNAWGWGAFVWTQLIHKYGLDAYAARRDPDFDTSSVYEGDSMMLWRYLWHVQNQGKLDLLPEEHNVLLSTADWAVVRSEDFATLAESLRRFEAWLGDRKRVCHLAKMGDDIDQLVTAQDVIGICWYGMSVSENPWLTYDEETDDPIAYNFRKNDNHFEVDIRSIS